MAFRSNLSIITGAPSTGKTTILRAIIEVFGRLYPSKKIMLAAPTGRASRRMAKSTGRNDAKTLHSVLGLLGDSGYVRDKKKEPLDADLIIVDVSSMIDMWLANHFFSRIRPGTKVILVGDVDQLQSVGAGDVFRELINCGRIPVTVLNEIFRQKQDSLIAHNAKAINEDSTNLYYRDDFLFLKCKTQEEAADIICTQFCDLFKKFGIEKVQILSPFRAEELAVIEQLSRTIRELVNPPENEDIPDLKIGSRYFRVGDKVMQNKNNAKASNGDIGFIRKIAVDDKNEMKVTIDFGTDHIVEYGMEDMGNVEIAYATTIHKSQGSEYDVVIIPVLRSHAIMLRRNLIYTAITRAKRRVILVGEKGILFMAIHKNDTGVRNTLPGERINKYMTAYDTEREKLKKVS